MKIPLNHIAVVAVAVAALAGCAAEPLASRTPSKVALITAGHFYSSTSFGPEILVLEVDGRPTDLPYGPIALAPGAHSLVMKCGDAVRAQTLNVAAGEVYQFSMLTKPGVKGCWGTLSRVRSARKLG